MANDLIERAEAALRAVEGDRQREAETERRRLAAGAGARLKGKLTSILAIDEGSMPVFDTDRAEVQGIEFWATRDLEDTVQLYAVGSCGDCGEEAYHNVNSLESLGLFNRGEIAPVRHDCSEKPKEAEPRHEDRDFLADAIRTGFASASQASGLATVSLARDVRRIADHFDPPLESISPPAEDEDRARCPDCDRDYASESTLARHRESAHS